MTRILAILPLMALAACAAPQGEVSRDGIYDPYETGNRRTHEFNKSLDRAVVRPVGIAYTTVMPDGLETVVENVSDNLSIPASVVNHLLQGDIANAARNTFRFVVNSTMGVLGTGDPAQELFGVDPIEADFGQTLHVWGAGEGAYVELPVLGPSTTRDTMGTVVDLFTDPFSYVLPKPERYYDNVAWGMKTVGNRGRYAGTVDDLLYNSADSYAQARILYLQNRRYELGMPAGSVSDDPYDDPYGQTIEDPYDDPTLQ